MIPAPLTRWQLLLYRVQLPFRLWQHSIVRKARSQAAYKGHITRKRGVV